MSTFCRGAGYVSAVDSVSLFDLALGVSLGRLSVGDDPGVDRGKTLACYLVFLPKETTLKGFLSMAVLL